MTRTSGRAIPTHRAALSYFWRFVVLVRPFWGRMAGGLWIGVLVGLVAMASPYLSKALFDSAYPTRDIGLMHVVVVGMLVLSCSSSLMGAVRAFYSQSVMAQLSRTLGLLFFNHVQHLPTAFFDEHRVGEILSRGGDVRSTLAKVTGILQTVMVNGVFVVLVPPFLVLLNWRLALLSMIALPITTAVAVASGRILRTYTKRSLEIGAEVSAFQMEALSHIRTLKALAAEHYVYRRVSDQLDSGMKAQLRAAGVGAAVGIANGLIRAGGGALFAWYAWTLILHGELTLGAFIAFSAYLGYLTGPVGQFASLFADFQQTAVTLGRTFEYLDREPEQDPAGAYLPAPAIHRRIAGAIELRNVTFGYAAGCAVVRDLSLSLERGMAMSIVGPNGAGKSSVLRLICRLAEPTAGSIAIDGIPLTAYPLADLRRQMAAVWQDATLMSGTIWDNLTVGLEEVDRVVVDRAIDLCRLNPFLAALPDGYDTPVAEWGATLSGGQRQRLAIARALIRDTPILLLDEATSQLDVELEADLIRDVLRERPNRTALIVTHRMTAAGLADKVCVLEAGGLGAVGTHRQVLFTSDRYRRMHTAVGAAIDPGGLAVVAAR